ncbi:hypothetical protein [Mycobacterium lepromatosis]
MEIVIWVLQRELRHQDDACNVGDSLTSVFEEKRFCNEVSFSCRCR